MKAFSVGIGNLPMNPKQLKWLGAYFNKLDGFIAVHPHYPDGTLLFFNTFHNALTSKNLLEYDGIQTATYIMECEISEDFRNVYVKGKATK